MFHGRVLTAAIDSRTKETEPPIAHTWEAMAPSTCADPSLREHMRISPMKLSVRKTLDVSQRATAQKVRKQSAPNV